MPSDSPHPAIRIARDCLRRVLAPVHARVAHAWPAATLILANTLAAAPTNHWAFQPLSKPVPPAVTRPDWVRTPVDLFVLNRLEHAGRQPAPPANRRTLIRRATLDLTGLPPTPAEVDAFASDPDPEAFPRLVDRLLASPRYGERWGRHWLDLARFADSNGMDENLAYGSAYRYRDYVIGAFNRDLPFHRFVQEQLAGDLLPPPAPDEDMSGQIVATGFLTLGPKMLAEDDPVKMEMDIVDEQLDSTCRVFMGLTAGCARCHDHKYDPVTMKDYYAMAGIFKSTRTMENFKVVARWQEVPIGPTASISAWRAQKKQIDDHQAKVSGLVGQATEHVLTAARRHAADYLLAATEHVERDRWLAMPRTNQEPFRIDPSGRWIAVEAEDFDKSEAISVSRSGYGEGIGVVLGPGGKTNAAEYVIPVTRGGTFRLETRYAAAEARPVRLFINGILVKPDAAGKKTGGWNPDAQQWVVEGDFSLRAGDNRIRFERSDCFPHIDKFLLARADAGIGGDAVAPPAAGSADPEPLHAEFVNQWRKYLEKSAGASDSIFTLWHQAHGGPAAPTPTNASAATLHGRLYETPIPPGRRALAERYRRIWMEAEEAWRKATNAPGTQGGTARPTALADRELERFRDVLYSKSGPFAVPKDVETCFTPAQKAELAGARAVLKSLEAGLPVLPEAMAVSEGKAGDLRIHKRGSHLNLGEPVSRGFVASIPAASAPSIDSGHSGRLPLALWMTHPEHPLTSRVIVNRIWHWHFGEGLVRSPDNFGVLGEKPTHPELLDWLARWFVDSGWSIKALHRLLMNSAVYQQASANPSTDGPGVAPDPENRLLSHFSRRRLEAEAIRDSVLFVSGGLDSRMGGTMLSVQNRTYVTSTANKIDTSLFNAPRRSLYLPVVRSALYDVFQVFDFADPSILNGRRDQTVVAPQALFMMNSELVSNAALRLARGILSGAGRTDVTRVDELFQIAFGRSPSAAESDAAVDYLRRYQQKAATVSPRAVDVPLKAWQSLCRATLAANEFIHLD